MSGSPLRGAGLRDRGIARESPDRRARLAAFAAGAGLEPPRVVDSGVAAQREFAARVVARDVEPWPVLRSMRVHEAALSDLEWTRNSLQ